MEQSRVTSKYQATVPADVRAALGVRAGDKIGWRVEGDTATVFRIVSEEDAWNAMIEANLAVEWLSAEDEEAFRDL